MENDPDPHGQAALMLCEVLMILLLEQGVVSKELALDAIDDVVAVKQEMAGSAEGVVVSLVSIGLIRAVAQSLAAVTPSSKPTQGRSS